METIGPILIVTVIPLILGLVPPNRIYGFRVGATLRDRTIWYDINRRAGWHTLGIGLLMVALELVLPTSMRNGVLSTVAVVGLLVIVIANWRSANRLERERVSGSAGRVAPSRTR